MRNTISMTADALATTLGESLLSVDPDQFGSLSAFVPDTPWTTTPIHVVQRHQGRVFVDSKAAPRNLVVIAQGDPSSRTLDQAYLFGAAASDAIESFVRAVKGPMELVCDDEVARLVTEHHPEARRRESIVHWFDRLEGADGIDPASGPRRLRIAEADQVGALVPGTALRTFRTVKEMVTGGTCYVVEDGGTIVSAAFTVDQSVKYERISCSTLEKHRSKGHAGLVLARVVRAVADQGRIPCVVTDRRDDAALRLATKLGFDRRALMTTFVTAFRK